MSENKKTVKSNTKSRYPAPEDIEQIKRDMIDVYDVLVEEDVFPSIERLRNGLKYFISEQVARDCRESLAKRGDLPPVLHGNPVSFRDDRDGIGKGHTIEQAKAEKERLDRELAESIRASQVVKVQTVSEWAIARYGAAWKSIKKLMIEPKHTYNPETDTPPPRTCHRYPVYAASGADVF